MVMFDRSTIKSDDTYTGRDLSASCGKKNVAFRQVRAGMAAPAHHLGPELSLSHPDGDWCLASVKFSL